MASDQSEKQSPLVDFSEDRQSAKLHKEHLYKVLVIGDFGVGKTSIIKRYTEGIFSPNYKLTIGVDFSLKSLDYDSDTKINLQLWDIAGHERFGHMTRVYYKYAIAAIVVFDLTRQVTFDSVIKWLGDVNQKVVLENGEPVPVVLLANKCDIENPQVDITSLEKFCSKHNISGWYATSAKEGKNITEAMNFLIGKILELSSREADIPTDVVDLGSPDGSQTPDNTSSNYTTSQQDQYTTGSTTNPAYLRVGGKMNGLKGEIPRSSRENKTSPTCAC